MKYYCKNCKAELITHEDNKFGGKCAYCANGLMTLIPDHETPEQYKARTGKDWPDWGPVWYRSKYGTVWAEWTVTVYDYLECIDRSREEQVICVQGPNPPPDDWRAEE